jgi:hypothetical protein
VGLLVLAALAGSETMSSMIRVGSNSNNPALRVVDDPALVTSELSRLWRGGSVAWEPLAMVLAEAFDPRYIENPDWTLANWLARVGVAAGDEVTPEATEVLGRDTTWNTTARPTPVAGGFSSRYAAQFQAIHAAAHAQPMTALERNKAGRDAAQNQARWLAHRAGQRLAAKWAGTISVFAVVLAVGLIILGK